MPGIDSYGKIGFDKYILMLTTDYILYLKVPDFFKVQQDQQILLNETLMFSEKLSNILNYHCKMHPGKISNSTNTYKEPAYFMTLVFNKK